MKNNILMLAFIISFTSCKKDKIAGPQGPQGPPGPSGASAKGSIAGKVKQYNYYGEQYATNLNTCTVSIAGTEISTVTDATGSYTLSEVSNGIHEIIFSRPNSGVMKMQQVSFPGNGNLIQNMSINDKATYSIISAAIKDTMYFGLSSLKISLSIASDTKARKVLLVFGKNQNIDPSIADAFEYQHQIEIPSGVTNVDTYMPYEYTDLEKKFNTGATVHAKFFPCAVNDGGYYDYVSEKSINTSCGSPLPANFSFVMP